MKTRYRLASALRTSASSKCSTGKARNTSSGAGRITLGMSPPYESRHQSARKVATPNAASDLPARASSAPRTCISAE